MMLEVEVKIRLSDIAQFEDCIRSIATFSYCDNQKDTYFIPRRKRHGIPDRFRLRQRGDQYFVGYKQDDRVESGSDASPLRYQVSEEIEFQINDPEEFERFAEAVGFRAAATVSKQRTVYSHGRVTIEINKVDEVGDFAELEVLCKPGFEAAAKREIAELLMRISPEYWSVEARRYTDLP